MKFTLIRLVFLFAVYSGDGVVRAQTTVGQKAGVPLQVTIDRLPDNKDKLQLTIFNQSQANVTVDLQSVKDFGFSITKEISSSSGEPKEVHWGEVNNFGGGGNTQLIMKLPDRTSIIVPNGKFTTTIDCRALFQRLPDQFKKSSLKIQLSLCGLILSADDNRLLDHSTNSFVNSNELTIDVP